MKSISIYVDNGSYLTKLHPLTKIFYIVTAIAVTLIAGNRYVSTGVILVSLILLASGKILRKTIPLISFSFMILITIFIIHGLFHRGNENVLFQIGTVKFYKEGLDYSLSIMLNVLNLLLSFAVFILTTKPAELVEELEKKGVSSKAGYIISSVFQIIPQMMGTMNTITDAQKSRGVELEGKLTTRMKAFLPLISPVVMSSLINTKERAIALEVRCFESKNKRTFLNERKKCKADPILCSVFTAVIIVTIVWRTVLCH